jgi:thiol-disulfide isomerase/thioredoxin
MNARRRLACTLFAALALAACKRDATPPAAAPAASPASQPAPAAAQPAAVSAPSAAQAQARKNGADAIPVLEVKTIDAKPWRLADHRGRWVVVNYWATWCGPCLKEMPDLSALDAMREDVDVIGLAYEDTTPADLRAFLVKHPVVYPVAIADVYAPPAAFDAPRGLPTTWLIAPDGRVARHFLGPVTAADLQAAIAAGPPAG